MGRRMRYKNSAEILDFRYSHGGPIKRVDRSGSQKKRCSGFGWHWRNYLKRRSRTEQNRLYPRTRSSCGASATGIARGPLMLSVVYKIPVAINPTSKWAAAGSWYGLSDPKVLNELISKRSIVNGITEISTKRDLWQAAGYAVHRLYTSVLHSSDVYGAGCRSSLTHNGCPEPRAAEETGEGKRRSGRGAQIFDRYATALRKLTYVTARGTNGVTESQTSREEGDGGTCYDFRSFTRSMIR